jgi:Uma2 family endonuclease
MVTIQAADDLPDVPPCDLWSDEPPLETYRHLVQILLLLSCLEWWWQDRNDFFAAGNLSIYYNIQQLRTKDFRGPDFFVVLDTERKERKSWVVWEEDGKYPNLILEILSSSTAKVDRGLKKQLYQNTFRTPEYFWFDPYSMEFIGFRLSQSQYEEIPPNEQGWRWSQQLNLFLGIHNEQLRFFTPEGALVPTPQEEAIKQVQVAQAAQEEAARQTQLAQAAQEEVARQTQLAQTAQRSAEQEQQRVEQERQRVEQEQQRAEQEQQRAERLAARLRELGVDPTQL